MGLTLDILVAAAVFAYLYINDYPHNGDDTEDNLFRYAWLLISVALIGFAFILNSAIGSTTYNTTTGVTTYAYAALPGAVALGEGLGILVVIVGVLYVYIVVRKIMKALHGD